MVMTVSKPKSLFYPTYHLPESETFEIPVGGQVTVVAMGLNPGDQVTFELVFTPAIQPDLCACPPGIVDLPSVAAATPLICCGQVVTLTDSNPFVVMDSPQGMRVRGVLNASDPDNVWVWAINTNTPDVTDRLRGCSDCETAGD